MSIHQDKKTVKSHLMIVSKPIQWRKCWWEGESLSTFMNIQRSEPMFCLAVHRRIVVFTLQYSVQWSSHCHNPCGPCSLSPRWLWGVTAGNHTDTWRSCLAFALSHVNQKFCSWLLKRRWLEGQRCMDCLSLFFWLFFIGKCLQKTKANNQQFNNIPAASQCWYAEVTWYEL